MRPFDGLTCVLLVTNRVLTWFSKENPGCSYARTIKDSVGTNGLWFLGHADASSSRSSPSPRHVHVRIINSIRYGTTVRYGTTQEKKYGTAVPYVRVRRSVALVHRTQKRERKQSSAPHREGRGNQWDSVIIIEPCRILNDSRYLSLCCSSVVSANYSDDKIIEYGYQAQQPFVYLSLESGFHSWRLNTKEHPTWQ